MLAITEFLVIATSRIRGHAPRVDDSDRFEDVTPGKSEPVALQRGASRGESGPRLCRGEERNDPAPRLAVDVEVGVEVHHGCAIRAFDEPDRTRAGHSLAS